MCHVQLKRHLIYTLFLAGCLASNLFLHQSAFAQSKCGTGQIRESISHLFSSTFNYVSTSNADKLLFEVEKKIRSISLECPPGITLYSVTQSNIGWSGGDILPIGEPGLGVKLIMNGQTLSGMQQLGNSINIDTIKMQLMQNGPIASGQISMVRPHFGTVNIYGSDDPATPLVSIRIGTSGRATFRDVMCRLDRNITQVTLRNALLSEFKSVHTRLAPQSFRISINNCATGVGLYNLSYRVDPMHTPFARGVSGPSSDSTAKGIGVQILNSGLTTLEFGTNYPVISSGANRSIDLHAAYYQLENNPTAGSVNASFMLTLMVN